MPRPRMFDEERAVDAALDAFWAAGYEATSTQDLCEATGLGRSSIYNTFKSKHELFLRALDRYLDLTSTNMISLMASDQPAMAKVRELLGWVLSDERGAGRSKAENGCLFINTAVELAARDEEIARRLERDYRRRLSALTGAIETGQRNGEIDSGKDAGTLAHFVIATISGMRVSARAGAGLPALEGIAATALAAL